MFKILNNEMWLKALVVFLVLLNLALISKIYAIKKHLKNYENYTDVVEKTTMEYIPHFKVLDI